MILDWEKVLGELKSLKELGHLSPLTLDTLHGSMWGLNIRYTSLDRAIENHRQPILDYSIRRVQILARKPPAVFSLNTPPKSQIGLGTYKWKYDPQIVRDAVDLGVSIIDTAEGYGYGRVEQALGDALVEHDPDQTVNVYTKVRRDHMSPSAIGNALRRSRKKLRRSFHAQTHFPHPQYPLAIKTMARETVLGVGLGNCSVDMVESAQQSLSRMGATISSVQVRFSVLDQRIKDCLLPYCQDRGILVIAYSPLSQMVQNLNITTVLQIAKETRSTPAQIALAWILSHPGVVPVPGTNSLSHLRENVDAQSLHLTTGSVDRIHRSHR